MRMKKLLSRMLLVAAGLCVGANASWADVPTYTWDFTDTETWTTAKVSTGSAVTLNPSGETPGDGEYGVTFKFTENMGIVGIVSTSRTNNTSGLWWEKSTNAYGSTENNYVSIVIPAGFKVTVSPFATSSRTLKYTLDGGTTTTEHKSTDAITYKNETENSVTLIAYAKNPDASYYNIGITSIVLEDLSAAASHQWSATAVIKNMETAIDSWTGDTYQEGETYTVWAKKVITYNNQYYELDDDNFTGNAATFSTTMGSDDYEHTISYTLKTDIVYFTDGSDATATGCSVSEHNDAEGGNTGYWINTNMVNTDISAGIYQVQLCNYSQNGNNGRAIGVFLDDTSVGSFAATYKTEQSVYFTAPSDGNLKIYGTASSNKATNNVDYVIIRKTADLPSTEKIQVTSADYATYVSDYNLDFSEATTKAYKVNVASKGIATLEEVEQVPAKTPVLLYCAGGNGEGEEITVITTAPEAVSDNDLVPGTGAAVETVDGDYTNMILNNVNGIGFYFAAGQTVAANRAYLHIATSLAPSAKSQSRRMVMVFAGDATAISETPSLKNGVQNAVYNMQGQRFGKPQKGLYIVKGKKVIMN